jgi:murein peptide amidase A
MPAFNSRVAHPGDTLALNERLRALAMENSWDADRAELKMNVAATFTHEGCRYEMLCARIAGGPAGHDPIRVGLFAGIHGDEPAGCAALVDLATSLAADPARVAGYELYFYPIVNPVGCARGTRANHAGKDLNREFWRNSDEVEVRAIEAELRAHQFHGIITLHTDDTSEGLYGYAHGRTLNEALLAPALEAAKQFLPLDGRAIIDGFPARAGLICDCFSGVLSAPPEQRPQPFDLIFETPGSAPFDLQVSATVAALDSIIRTYPGFIAYAQDL